MTDARPRRRGQSHPRSDWRKRAIELVGELVDRGGVNHALGTELLRKRSAVQQQMTPDLRRSKQGEIGFGEAEHALESDTDRPGLVVVFRNMRRV
jgi:hypothetical protein